MTDAAGNEVGDARHARGETIAYQPLAGRTALITGAAGDIGRAAAVPLATAGARVVLADIADGVAETAAMCSGADPAAAPTTITFDVTNEADVQPAFDDLTAQGITADLLFNNAGYQGSVRQHRRRRLG
jgi:NAD(P)-dependent dehydrogenase (short-subunit alcohol dehydrogenase family)